MDAQCRVVGLQRSAQPGPAPLSPRVPAHTCGPPLPRTPPTTPPPAAQRSRAALGHLPQGEQRGGAGRGDAGWGCGETAGPGTAPGVGQRGRGGGVRVGGWVGVHAGARGRAWPGCAHHCAHVFGGCTRVCVSVVPGAARGGVPVPGCAHTCLGRLRFRPPPRELPEPPECRCRGARVRPLLPLFGHFGPVQSARGGRARPPHPPAPSSPARSLPVPPPVRAPPPPPRHEQLPVQQGPLLRPLRGGQEPGERRRGRWDARASGGLSAEKSRGCSEGPDAIRRMRSRVPGRGGCRGRASVVGRSDSAPGGPEGSGRGPGHRPPPLSPRSYSLRGEWGDGPGPVQLRSRGFSALCFPTTLRPSGGGPDPILSLVDSRARTGPCCGTGRGQGNPVTLLGLFALKEDAGCCREGCIPTLRAGLGAPGWVHSPGCAPFLLWEWSSAMGGCSGPLPFPVHHCSPCSTGMGSAVGCPTQDGCGMRTRLGLGSPSRPHRIWVSSPCEDGPLLAPGGWTRAGASPLPAPRCFSLVQQELSQSDGPAVQAAR